MSTARGVYLSTSNPVFALTPCCIYRTNIHRVTKREAALLSNTCKRLYCCVQQLRDICPPPLGKGFSMKHGHLPIVRATKCTLCVSLANSSSASLMYGCCGHAKRCFITWGGNKQFNRLQNSNVPLPCLCFFRNVECVNDGKGRLKTLLPNQTFMFLVFLWCMSYTIQGSDNGNTLIAPDGTPTTSEHQNGTIASRPRLVDSHRGGARDDFRHSRGASRGDDQINCSSSFGHNSSNTGGETTERPSSFRRAQTPVGNNTQQQQQQQQYGYSDERGRGGTTFAVPHRKQRDMNNDDDDRRGAAGRGGAGEGEGKTEGEHGNHMVVEPIHCQAGRTPRMGEAEQQEAEEEQDGEYSSQHHALAGTEASRHSSDGVGETISASLRGLGGEGDDGRDSVGRTSFKRPRWYARQSVRSSDQDPRGGGGEGGRPACGQQQSFHDNTLAAYGV